MAPTADQALDDGVGLRAVADDVAEVPDGVDRAGLGEDRVEGQEVAVDVREDRDPHRRASLAAGAAHHGRRLRARGIARIGGRRHAAARASRRRAR